MNFSGFSDTVQANIHRCLLLLDETYTLRDRSIFLHAFIYVLVIGPTGALHQRSESLEQRASKSSTAEVPKGMVEATPTDIKIKPVSYFISSLSPLFIKRNNTSIMSGFICKRITVITRPFSGFIRQQS